LKAIENDFDKTRKRYIQQIDSLNEKNSELEMKVIIKLFVEASK